VIFTWPGKYFPRDVLSQLVIWGSLVGSQGWCRSALEACD
jgi:hypothetical protein